MRKKMSLLVKTAVVLSLIFAVIFAVGFTGQTLNFVVDSYVTEEAVYGIDDGGKTIGVFQTDAAGKLLGKITLPKQKDGLFSTLDYLNVDQDGQVYVYEITKEILSNRVQWERVYRCDFKKGKLIPVWELPILDPENQNSFAIQVRQGKLTYFTVGYDTQNFAAQANLYQMDQNTAQAQLLQTVDYDIGISFSDFFYADNGYWVFTTPDGQIFKVDGQGHLQPLKPMDGREKYQMASFSQDGSHTLYVSDLATHQVMALDLSLGKHTAFLDMNQNFGVQESLTFSDLKNLRFTQSSRFSATVPGEGGRSVLGIFDQSKALEPQILSKLGAQPGDMFLSGVLAFVGGLAFFLVLWLLSRLFLKFTGGKFPMVTKLIVAFIPILVVSLLVLQGMINSIFVKEMVESQYKELLLVSKQQMEGISASLLAEIDPQRPYDKVYYYELRQLLNALPGYAQLYEAPGQKPKESALSDQAQGVYNFSYHWLYQVKNGQLMSLFCDQNYIDIPVDYYYHKDVTKLFYQVLEEKKTLKGGFKDVGGDWLILLSPILDEQGQVMAVMETGTTKASMEYRVQQNTKKISLVNLVVMVVLIGVLSVVILISLDPLKTLKKRVEEITEGKLGVQAPVQGSDEIAEIAGVFNKMSTAIEGHVGELNQLNEGYFKFVPSKMFDLLRKTSVTDVHLGDQRKAEVTVLTFNTVGFGEMVSAMTAEAMFKLINQILSNLVPIVSQQDGVIDKFENAGLVAFYAGGSQAAIQSAISIFQKVDQVNQDQGFGIAQAIHMSAAISQGPVMIGIVGHEQRLAATTISEHTNLTGFLRQVAPKYNARILTTGTVTAKIGDFGDKFSNRFIGFLYVRATRQTEKLYDLFDGDEEEIRLLKKQTKGLFEKGVNLYCTKEFYEARLVFIEVLKQFRQDAAAKEYLYLCDQYYQMQDTSRVEICIEQY